MAQVNINPNEDTEFHDALRARGIIPQKAPSRSPSPELPTESEQRSHQIQNATLSQLNRALESDGLGRLGEEEEKLLLKIKEQRLKNIRKEEKRNRFGRVYPIGRPDYTREVTEASKQNPDRKVGLDDDEEEEGDGEEEDDSVETGAGSFGGKKELEGNGGKGKNRGTGVVCFLYKDGMETCQLLSGYLDTLAAKFPSTKFVSIVGDKCIPNYPDKNLPTLLVYRNGELHRQIVGLRPEIGLDGMNTKLGDIELLLTAVGVLDPSTVPGNPTNPNGKDPIAEEAERAEEAGEDEDEGFGGNRNGAAARGSKIRGPAVKSQEEEDAELDWDL